MKPFLADCYRLDDPMLNDNMSIRQMWENSQTYRIHNQSYLDFARLIGEEFKSTVRHIGEIWNEIWDMTPTQAISFLNCDACLGSFLRARAEEKYNQE